MYSLLIGLWWDGNCTSTLLIGLKWICSEQSTSPGKIEQSTQLPNAFDTNHHSCFLKVSLALVSETVLSCLPLSWAYCPESSAGSFLSMGLFMGLCHFFIFIFSSCFHVFSLVNHVCSDNESQSPLYSRLSSWCPYCSSKLFTISYPPLPFLSLVWWQSSFPLWRTFPSCL